MADAADAADDDVIPLSALQHWLYCPRQCALIHVERLWEENRFTAEGRLLHERTDQPKAERRRGVRTLTAVPVRSARLRVTGIADVVELRNGAPYPVEYKRGRPKAHRADEVQLCAQAICLEEMFGVAVPEGALFYGEPRRQTRVALDAELRSLTERVAAEASAALLAGRTPQARYEKRKCGACSLLDQCRPKALGRASAAAWFGRAVAGSLAE
jgi:CRISPR-associated exonuclease Cas4